jgi:hypothetical protein
LKDVDCEGHPLGQTHHRRYRFRFHPPTEGFIERASSPN